MTEHSEEITRLLTRVGSGDEEAKEKLFPLIYEQLRGMARQYMRKERSEHTLQPTALVHEAFLKLGGGENIDWTSRAQFIRYAAQAMRNILIDYARKKNSAKRGPEHQRQPLKDDLVVVGDFSTNILSLNGSLNRLTEVDEQMGRIVELRFFGGLTVDETARVLKVSSRTVTSEWRLAKAWLKNDIGG